MTETKVIAYTRLSSRDFHWNAASRTFSEEISTLSQGRNRQVFSQVWNDSCDEGFVMVSALTGCEVVFAVDKVDYSGEDIAGWWLVPIRESIRKHPGCSGVKVLIIND